MRGHSSYDPFKKTAKKKTKKTTASKGGFGAANTSEIKEKHKKYRPDDFTMRAAEKSEDTLLLMQAVYKMVADYIDKNPQAFVQNELYKDLSKHISEKPILDFGNPFTKGDYDELKEVLKGKSLDHKVDPDWDSSQEIIF